MNKIYKTAVNQNIEQNTIISTVTKEHKKPKSLTTLLTSAMMSMLLPNAAMATLYPETLTGNVTDDSAYGSIKSNPDPNTTLYSLSAGDIINVVDDQLATSSDAEANAIKLDTTTNNKTLISGSNLTIGAEAKINPNTNGNSRYATAHALNMVSGTPSAQEIEFVGPVTLSAQTQHESIDNSLLPDESINIQFKLSAYGIDDFSGHAITFQDQAKIETQTQGNNLTLFADNNIYISTNLSATGINYVNASNNSNLIFAQNALVNTKVKGASQYLTTTSDITTQISNYNNLTATGISATNLSFLGSQTDLITELLSGALTINTSNNQVGSLVDAIKGTINNDIQALSGSMIDFNGNVNILTHVIAGHVDISSAAEQIQSIRGSLSTGTMGVNVNGLTISGDQTKIVTEVLSENMTLSTSNSGENSLLYDIDGMVSNDTQGLTGNDIAVNGNADILTHSTIGRIDITAAAEQIGYIRNNQSTNTMGATAGRLSLDGEKTNIITEVVVGSIAANTSNSEANSVVSALYGSMNNYTQGLTGSDIYITGNVDIETRLTQGNINLTSAAAQIGTVQNNIHNNTSGISIWRDTEFKGAQTNIITEVTSGLLTINTSNSGANSVVSSFDGSANNNVQSIFGSDFHINGNADIQTRSTVEGINITSAAEQIGNIQSNLQTNIYGVNGWDFNVKGDQTNIITTILSGGLVIKTSNHGINSYVGTINGSINSTNQGISGDNLNFDGNLDVQTVSTSGSLAITSTAEKIQSINNVIHHETYGVSAWASMNVNGGQTNIISKTLFGDLSITANNSTQIDNISALMQSFTSGLSASATDVHFQGNTNIVATNNSGNLIIDAPLAQGALNNIAINLYATGIQNTPVSIEQSLNVITQASAGNILINAPSLTMDTDPSLLAQAEGLLASHMSQTTRIAGDTQILASAASGVINLNGSISNGNAMAYGVHAQNSTLVDLQGNVSIQAIANAHQDSTIASGIEQAYALFAETDSAININQVGGKNVQLVGDLVADNSGLIYLNMDTANSYLRGLVNNQGGEINVALGNGATWQPTGNGDVTSNIRSALANSNISSTFGNGSPLDLQAGGIIDLAWWNNQNNQLNPNNRYRSLTIDNMVFNDGGEFRINTDIEHNQADKIIVTNAAGSGTQHIQVAYDPAMASMTGDHIILTATTLIPVLEVPVGTPINTVMGEIASIDSGLYRWTTTPEIIWDAATGVASIGQLDIHRTGNLSETPLTVSDAYTSLLNHWQLESSNMMRRVGDLRLSTENQNGVWARTYYGSLKSDSSYDRRFNQEFSGVQTGYDHQFDINAGKMSTGLMFNALQSDSSYSRGDGELTSYGVGVYTSWMSETGHYLDVVIRTSRLNNEYRLLDKNEQPAKGNYHTWAYGMSTEYGYRAQLDKQWFVEPQVELNLGRINNSAYSTSNGFRIDQAADNMVSSRVGLLLGTAFGEAIPSGNAYVRASWIYDFNRKGDVSVAYLDQSTKLDTLNRRGSAVEVNVGTNLKLAKQWHTYAELGKTWGNVVETDWQVNTGLRYNW